jgi:hypothetical protein
MIATNASHESPCRHKKALKPLLHSYHPRMRLPWLRLCAATLSISVFCGCANVDHWTLTGALWDNESLALYREPAIPPHLRLYDQKSDVVVTYYETSDSSDRRTHRAYNLKSNDERIRQQQKPRFLNTTPESGPEIPQLPATSNDHPGSLYVIVSNDEKTFTLVRDGKSEGPYELPVYSLTSGTPAKIALTPVTLIGDTIIYASVIGIIAVGHGALNGLTF